jgi:hypothetical protein
MEARASGRLPSMPQGPHRRKRPKTDDAFLPVPPSAKNGKTHALDFRLAALQRFSSNA